MALTTTQQIIDTIMAHRHILIALRRDSNGDNLASALAMAALCKKLDKPVDIVCDQCTIKQQLSFLPLENVQPTLANIQQLIVSVDTSRTKISELYHDKTTDRLNIYLTPAAGQFAAHDISTKLSDYKYDLIITLGTVDLESLGELYNQHSDFFYQTPKINIDCHSANDHFGDINHVDLVSSSVAEIIYQLIMAVDPELIDENVATYLLTGIIIATRNFKNPHITPQTLNVASLLVARGARRGQIIQNLYQSRFVSTLKLWGRVLSRLNNDLDDNLVWSSLSHQDFLETATDPEELADVVEELISSMPKTEVIAIIYEVKHDDRSDIHALVHSTGKLDARHLAAIFNPAGSASCARLVIANTPLHQAERLLIDELKKKLI